MSTATKSYVIANATTTDAVKVEQNYNDILTFLNGSVVHRDGSKSFTGNIDGVTPVNSTHLANKGYVDGLVSGAGAQRRNTITNGNFDVWQRGVGPFTATGFTADMWKLFNGAGSTNSVSRSGPSVGGPGNPQVYSLAWNRTVAGSGNSSIYTNIETVQNFSGRTVTVSFYAQANTAMALSVYLSQFFGTGGAPSTSVASTAASLNITTTATLFTATFTLPSVAGKTLGTTGDSLIAFFERAIAQPNGIVNIWNVQLEDGSVATPFEYEPPSTTLARCQRYFVRFAGAGSIGTGYGNSATIVARCIVVLPQTMRATPTVTLVGAVGLFDGTNPNTTVTSFTSVIYHQNILNVDANTAGGITQYRPFGLYVGGGGSVDVSAELP